jgi:hypothetical protein
LIRKTSFILRREKRESWRREMKNAIESRAILKTRDVGSVYAYSMGGVIGYPSRDKLKCKVIACFSEGDFLYVSSEKIDFQYCGDGKKEFVFLAQSD